MDIRKIKSNRAIEAFIEAEQEKYEAENGVSCNSVLLCGDDRR